MVVAHTSVTELKGQTFTQGFNSFSLSQLNPSAQPPTPRLHWSDGELENKEHSQGAAGVSAGRQGRAGTSALAEV